MLYVQRVNANGDVIAAQWPLADVDLAAIANPEIRDEVSRIMQESGLSWQEAMAEAIARRRPDYVVVFPKWLPVLDSDPRFHPVYRLEVPDNITMGGDEIAVYSMPWTRWKLIPSPLSPALSPVPGEREKAPRAPG